jgi:hypothetical protein
MDPISSSDSPSLTSVPEDSSANSGPVLHVLHACQHLLGELIGGLNAVAPKPPSSDKLKFGSLWPDIKQASNQGQDLHALIRERRDEIAALKQHWRSRIEAWAAGNDFLFYQQLFRLLSTGKLIAVEEGSGGAYFLLDEVGAPAFVIKPNDEDIFCLNNHKKMANPFNDEKFRMKRAVPLYHAAQADLLSYRIAELTGLRDVTPKTVMAIISSDQFFDLSEQLPMEERDQFILLAGPPDKERLCSVQTYLHHSVDPIDMLYEWRDKGYSNRKIASLIDQDSFEKASIFIWLTYDGDAHPGNFRLCKHPSQDLFLIKKVDNDLTFPEQNIGLSNILVTLPNAKQQLSPENRRLIVDLPLDEMFNEIQRLEMDHATWPFKERVALLQQLAKQPLTIAEIHHEMKSIVKPKHTSITWI